MDRRRKDELPYEILEEPQLMEVPLEKPVQKPLFPFFPTTRLPDNKKIPRPVN